MKEKKLGYYQSLLWLDSKGAIELIKLIAGIELSEAELVQQIIHSDFKKALGVYVDIGGPLDGAVDSETGLPILNVLFGKQRIVSPELCRLIDSPLRLFIYHPEEYRPNGRVYLPSQPERGKISLEYCDMDGKRVGSCSADTTSLRSNYLVYFSRSEVEAWAKGISGSPDNQELQDENQRLKQELETLKAEVVRLQAENAQLKADDEVNPREKESLYKIIAAMAIDGYGHNLEAKTSSTVQDIVNASTRVGIPTPERTIRKHLSAALEVLPAKPIKT